MQLNSLAALKRHFAIGQTWHCEMVRESAVIWDAGERELVLKNSAAVGFTTDCPPGTEGDGKKRTSYLHWPKASEVTFLNQPDEPVRFKIALGYDDRSLVYTQR